MIFLSKIETKFSVSTRGWVVVPVALTNPDIQVKAGDAIQLRDSERYVDARIDQIERLIRHDGGCPFGFLVSEEIDCSQIGSDAEIWIEPSK
jgi:hypothetical protein